MEVLLTGGAGYIGSHACVEFLNQGYDVVVIDNLSNSKQKSLKRVEAITKKTISFYHYDLLEKDKTDTVFSKHSIKAVIHFAGLKAVGESVEKPLTYYQNNLISTLNLLEVMKKHKVHDFVFSSSATVYGIPKKVPILEDFTLQATSPYGRSKLMIENILNDFYLANKNFNIAILRYFNPIGAHASGLIGEDPNDIPNNLLPYISQVAIGKLKELFVFGNDYPTIDGTGVRDYIHVVDLVIGHVKALSKLQEKVGLVTYNLGTGRGIFCLGSCKCF